jgi:hypothetical protein
MVISLYVVSWLADIPIPRTNEIDIIFGYVGSMCQRKHGREKNSAVVISVWEIVNDFIADVK